MWLTLIIAVNLAVGLVFPNLLRNLHANADWQHMPPMSGPALFNRCMARLCFQWLNRRPADLRNPLRCLIPWKNTPQNRLIHKRSAHTCRVFLPQAKQLQNKLSGLQS